MNALKYFSWANSIYGTLTTYVNIHEIEQKFIELNNI
jgi:hypothetical protein